MNENYRTQRAVLDDAAAAFGGLVIAIVLVVLGGAGWLILV